MLMLSNEMTCHQSLEEHVFLPRLRVTSSKRSGCWPPGSLNCLETLFLDTEVDRSPVDKTRIILG